MRGWHKQSTFLHIKRSGAEFIVEGTPKCFLGHKITREDSIEDGVFAEWNWNGKELTARTDRYGVYPLFYFSRPGEICISPSIQVLLGRGASAELNYPGLAVFLRLGSFIAEETPFREVHAFPPQGRLTWNGSPEISGGILIARSQQLALEEARAEYARLFRTAIERRITSLPSSLPLSGGRDSRHILLELWKQGRVPKRCATMKYHAPYTGEEQVAVRVAERVGVPHEVIDSAPVDPDFEAQKNVETNFCTTEHRWLLWFAEKLQGRQAVIYDGLAGDVMSAGDRHDERHLRFFESGDFHGLADYMLGEEYVSKLLSKPLRRLLSRELATDRLCTELRRHADAPNPVSSYLFFNRTRRVAAIGPYVLLERAGTVLTPFLDHDVWNFLASLPVSMFMDNQFHDKTIASSYPEFKDLPYAKKAISTLDASECRRRAASLLRFARKHRGLQSQSSVAARLIRCFVEPQYFLRLGALDQLVVYLCQLGAMAEKS